MKKLLFVLFVLFYQASFSQVIEVDSNPDSVRTEIGEIKSFNFLSPDTAIVKNIDKEEFILVGENVGQLVVSIVAGYETVRENVSKTEGRAMDWIAEIVKWLLGGGSLTSIIAYFTRTIGGVKNLFSMINGNRKLVVGIAGGVSLAWMLIQGGDYMLITFWMAWAAMWFGFSIFAIGLYEAVFSLFKKTPKTEAQEKGAIEKAKALLENKGAMVTFT